MLSVNRILIFLFIVIFSSSLYAIDVSNFDIKGIKLGMSKSEVLKKMPCSSPKIETQFIDTVKGKKLYWTSIECENNSDILHVILSRKNRVDFIKRVKSFNVSPSWDKIKKQIIKHYGNPTFELPNNVDVYPINNICWGGCRIRKHNNTMATFNKSLDFYANEVKNSFSTMIFLLTDEKENDNNQEWYGEQKRLYEQYQKEKASNIEF